MKHIRLWSILRESIMSAISQPVASLLTMLMVAGMCASVLLTTGRTVGTEESVLSTIDSIGTRLIVIRAEPQAEITSNVLDRIGVIDGVEWAAAFSDATDVSNLYVPGGPRIAYRSVWSSDLQLLGIPTEIEPQGTGWISSDGSKLIGLADNTGPVVSSAGQVINVAGSYSTPNFVDFLGPSVLVPEPAISDGSVGYVVVVAAKPESVGPLSRAVSSVLAPADPDSVTVSTSEQFAELRSVIEGTLGGFGRDLVVAISALAVVLVAATQYGLVMFRRKDFGRRRALGASRSTIILIVFGQVISAAIGGCLLGSLASVLVLLSSGDPLPGWQFTIATGVLAIFVSMVAAVLPAYAAASRDPLHELRVP